MVWNLFPFKGDFSFGKSQKSQGTKSGLQRGWVTWVIWCFTKNSARHMILELAHCRDEADNHQLPMAVAFCIIWIVSMKECSNLMQNAKFDRDWSLYSVTLNVTATQYTGSLNSIYHPRWLVQWSRHCSCMCVPVHSPWLLGYVNVVQTVLVILTMAGLFVDRPHLYPYICLYLYIHIYFYIYPYIYIYTFSANSLK